MAQTNRKKLLFLRSSSSFVLKTSLTHFEESVFNFAGARCSVGIKVCLTPYTLVLGDENLLRWSLFAYSTHAHLRVVRRMDILFPRWSPSLAAWDDSNSSRAFHDSSITWPLGAGKEQIASPRNPQEICDATAGFKKGYERREQTRRVVCSGRYGIWKLICEDLQWSNVCTTELFERLPFLFLSV